MNTTKGRSWDTLATVGAALCLPRREKAGAAHPDARLFFVASRKPRVAPCKNLTLTGIVASFVNLTGTKHLSFFCLPSGDTDHAIA